jgi:uncharacterized membrane protein YhiD involved in acid resistance
MLGSIINGGLTPENFLLCSALALVLGAIVAFVHAKTASYSRNFTTTLVILPILVQVVIMMVNGNLGTGVAILGAFSLVRFRSIPGTSREIASVFFAMSIGLATGTGYIGFAIIATIIISLTLWLLNSFELFGRSNSRQTLRITLPDDVDHESTLGPVFEKHQAAATLEMIKTINMGSLYELEYTVTLPGSLSRKTFLDDLRTRNGNLAITLYETHIKGGL